MADNEDLTLDPADRAAGLNPFKNTTPKDIVDPSIDAAIRQQTFEAEGMERERIAGLSTGEIVGDIARTTITGGLYEWATRPTFSSDPNFSSDRFKELFTEAQKTIQEDYLDDLYKARSEDEFVYRLGLAQKQQKAAQNLAGLGWGWNSANLLAQIVDPAVWVAGNAATGYAFKAVQTLRMGRNAQRAANALAVGGIGIGIEATRDSLDIPTPIENYVLAGGLGMAIGAWFGPLGQKIATQGEAKIIADAGDSLVQEARAVALRPTPSVPATSQAGIERLTRVYDVPAVPGPTEVGPASVFRGTLQEAPDNLLEGRAKLDGPEGEMQLRRLPAPEEAPAPAQPPAINKAIEDVSAALNGEAVDPIPSVAAAIDEAVNPASAAPEPAPSAGLAIEDPVAASQSVKRDIDELPEHLARRLKDRASDFAEWRAKRQASKTAAPKAKGKGKKRPTTPQPSYLLEDLGEFDIPEYNPSSATWMGADDLRLALHEVNEGGLTRNYFMHVPGDEEPIGFVTLKKRPQGWEVDAVEVAEGYRGQRIANRTYDIIERDLGLKLKPSGVLTDAGYKLWSRRNPDAVKWHRMDPKGKTWLSPKQLIAEEKYNRIDPRPNKQKLANEYADIISTLPPEALTPQSLGDMFATAPEGWDIIEGGGVSMHVAPTEADFAEAIKAAMRSLPRKIKVQVVDRIKMGKDGDAAGRYRPDKLIIELSRAMRRSAYNVANHEVVHALRNLGLFQSREWALLEKAAKDENWYSLFEARNYREAYRQQWLDEGIPIDSPEGQKFFDLDTQPRLTEEAIAHRYGQWAEGRRASKQVETLFTRIKEFIERLGAGLRREFGYETVEDVFRAIERGTLAKRPIRNAAARNAPDQFAVNAAPNPVVSDAFLEDTFVTQNQAAIKRAPRGAGFWRFDRAGRTTRSDNAFERLIGRNLLNDSVGMSDHSVNSFSADQTWRRIMNRYMGSYDKVRAPAFREWADRQGLSQHERWTREHEFYEEVGRYIRDRERSPGDYDAAVEKLGNKVATLQKEILNDLQNPMREMGLVGRAIKAAEGVTEDAHYLWRKFNNRAVIEAADENAFGETGVIRMVSGAIRSAQPDIDPELLTRLARGYVKNIRARAHGLGDEWSIAFSKGDWERLRHVMKNSGIDDADADDMIARMTRNKRPTGDMGNLKRRVFLDETYVERDLAYGRGGNGGVRNLAFQDLLESNVNNIFPHYLRRAAGRVALGQTRVTLDDGTVLINGIADDVEIEKIIRTAQQWGADNGQTAEQIQATTNRLRFAFDRALGVPQDTAQYGGLVPFLRLARAYTSARLMGQVGIAQLGEAGNALGQLGFKAGFQQLRSYRKLLDAMSDTKLAKEMLEELEAMGIGVERLHGMHYHNLDEIGDQPFEMPDRPILERWVSNARVVENATYEVSMMSLIQQLQERWVAGAMAQKIANMSTKLQGGGTLGRSDIRRLHQLGVSEDMLTKILAQMAKHASTDGSVFQAGKTLSKLNVDKWDDLGARHAFESAIFRATKKIIQSGDEGSAAMWMSNPIAQTWFQFRGYAFTAWANNLQYNIHMGDPTALIAFGTSVLWAAAVRAAQVAVVSAARSDGEEYREQNLGGLKLLGAGFQRSAFSSIVPMGADTFLGLMGQKGIFDARTTAQASDALFGSPIISTLDSFQKGVGGGVDAALRGRAYSQAEARSAFGLLPFANTLPLATGFSYLIKDLPERAPPARR